LGLDDGLGNNEENDILSDESRDNALMTKGKKPYMTGNSWRYETFEEFGSGMIPISLLIGRWKFKNEVSSEVD
jgi:hypothetical protein